MKLKIERVMYIPNGPLGGESDLIRAVKEQETLLGVKEAWADLSDGPDPESPVFLEVPKRCSPWRKRGGVGTEMSVLGIPSMYLHTTGAGSGRTRLYLYQIESTFLVIVEGTYSTE